MLRWRRVEVVLGKKRVKARVADTFLKRALGFMFYADKREDAILFQGSGCFWMLFVPQPLQLVVIEKGRVKEVVDMEPLSPKQVCVSGDYVLELINHRRVKVGTKVKITKGLS